MLRPLAWALTLTRLGSGGIKQNETRLDETKQDDILRDYNSSNSLKFIGTLDT